MSTLNPADMTEVMKWIDAHPNPVYAVSYDDIITNEMARLLMQGKFNEFDQAVEEAHDDYTRSDAFWADWESDFARAFGFESWSDVPEDMQEDIRDERQVDLDPWTQDAIRHWSGHVVATFTRPDLPEGDNLIYAPLFYRDELDERETEHARYLLETFAPALGEGDGMPAEKLVESLDVVYGGYDREHLVLGGRLDLLAIWKARQAPTGVTLGPKDNQNLLFYDFSNGCGNMGQLNLTRTVTLPATFDCDDLHRYGVDKCYGFTGSWWRHEIEAVMPEPAPEADLEAEAPAAEDDMDGLEP